MAGLPEQTESLVHLDRPARGEPAGALVLMHGRGTDERDLFGLFDLLDPAGRVAGATPRAPLTPPGHTGFHWYVVPRVGFPDPPTFAIGFERAAAWLDGFLGAAGVPIERTVLGGFSQGAVMSYALGLGSERPRPAGILALSGFVPQVDGWEPDLASRPGLPVLCAHGSRDPVISVSFGRAAAELLADAGLDVRYLETPTGHWVDERVVEEARDWLGEVLA